MADQDGRQSLTGVWHGLYMFDENHEVESFVATLMETGPFLTGTTHEDAICDDGVRRRLLATVDGEREGAAVYFDKTYDGTAGWNHLVRYQGALNSDWTEVEGRWTVPGAWSGRFLMIRSGSKTLAQARAQLVGV